jgi:hypothetical protein
MIDTNIPMTAVVLLALFGAMSLTICVAALIAKALDHAFDRWDRHQYSKSIAKMYRY